MSTLQWKTTSCASAAQPPPATLSLSIRYDAYAAFGSISNFRPSRDRQFFFIDYASVEEATAAVSARHVFIGECRTFVEFARPKPGDANVSEHASQHVTLDWRCSLCNFVNFAKVSFILEQQPPAPPPRPSLNPKP